MHNVCIQPHGSPLRHAINIALAVLSVLRAGAHLTLLGLSLLPRPQGRTVVGGGQQGLEALDLQGKVFDPELAEAVMHEPADEAGAETVVVEVLRTGYRWKGRVLRAAMVKVKG